MRIGTVTRKTKETDITIIVNLDGTGKFKPTVTDLGIGTQFIVHMINTFSRITLFFLTVGIFSTNYSQEPEWERISSPVNTTLTKLSFVNSLTGWASGEQGTIIKTSDGGIDWQIQNTGVSYFITGLCFIDENYGLRITTIISQLDRVNKIQ